MKENKFIEKLRETIRRFGLLNKGDRVLVAVSGGPDSVALLYGFFAIQLEFNLKLYVAHLNHKLRGAESDQDERFVKNLAERLKLGFFSQKTDVKKEAKKKKLSIEESAREIRYRFLENLADRVQADKIATGHQADDQAETFLMRLLRGAGGAGLSGIPAKRGKIIRPLIQTKREEIEKFLKANKIAYREDSSNYLPNYFRNKIRLSLLPKIKEEFNPKLMEVLNRTADIISSQQEYIEKVSEQILCEISTKKRSKIILDMRKFESYDICLQREMIRICVRELKGDLNQISFESIERAINLIRKRKSGRKVKLANRIWMEVSENQMAFFPSTSLRMEKEKYNYPLSFPGDTNLKEWGIKIKAEMVEPTSQKIFSQSPATAFLDWEKLEPPLILRTRRKGDRFKPLGMRGTKSVADFLIDAKVPHHVRDEIPILTSKERIVWVVGYRISNEFKVTDKTKKVLKVEVLD